MDEGIMIFVIKNRVQMGAASMLSEHQVDRRIPIGIGGEQASN